MATPKNTNGNGASDLAHASQLSIDDLELLLKQKKADAKKLSAEKGRQYKKELEAHCLAKYGVSLKEIYRADKTAIYKNPKTGVEYVYAGFGKIPEWLWISSDNKKPNPAYLVQTN